MTDHGAQPSLETIQAESPARELDRLATAYPAFRFSLDFFGRRGTLWVARRINGLNSGVHTVITADLAELHAVLASQEGTGHAR